MYRTSESTGIRVIRYKYRAFSSTLEQNIYRLIQTLPYILQRSVSLKLLDVLITLIYNEYIWQDQKLVQFGASS